MTKQLYETEITISRRAHERLGVALCVNDVLHMCGVRDRVDLRGLRVVGTDLHELQVRVRVSATEEDARGIARRWHGAEEGDDLELTVRRVD